MKPLVWFGPVWSGHVAGSVPEGYQLHVVPCVGDVQPPHARCTDVAAKWRAPDGRRLPELRRRLRLADDARPFVAAFSAGGQCIRRLLLDPRDRAEIAGVYLADATYGTWAQRGIVDTDDDLQRALVAMAVECQADGRPFVATASSHVPGGGGPSASVVLAALRAKMCAAGLSFVDALPESLFHRLRRAHGTAHRAGSVLLVDFGEMYTHAEHATKIAHVLLPRVVEGVMTDERRAPVQGDYWRPKGETGQTRGTITWAEHLTIFEAYAKKYGRDQSAERIAERGGFGYGEIQTLLGRAPATWRAS